MIFHEFIFQNKHILPLRVEQNLHVRDVTTKSLDTGGNLAIKSYTYYMSNRLYISFDSLVPSSGESMYFHIFRGYFPKFIKQNVCIET